MTSISVASLALLTLLAGRSFAQNKPAPSACSQAAFAASRDLPAIAYDCPADLTESDEKILKTLARVEALNQVVKELESFTDPAWWRADVNDLNRCEVHGGAGALSEEEQTRLHQGDYRVSLFGDHQMRLVLLADPCYQVGYNGSVGFLLYLERGRVHVTKILEGYYSRVDNSVGIDFANLNGQQVIEISTANSMPPAIANYYYAIDPRTGKAVPRLLFKQGRKTSNEIRSAMILGEPSELGLPPNAEDTIVIRHHRLLPSFDVYSEVYLDGEGPGRRLARTVYRWNGRYYKSTVNR